MNRLKILLTKSPSFSLKRSELETEAKIADYQCGNCLECQLIAGQEISDFALEVVSTVEHIEKGDAWVRPEYTHTAEIRLDKGDASNFRRSKTNSKTVVPANEPMPEESVPMPDSVARSQKPNHQTKQNILMVPLGRTQPSEGMR